MPYVRCLRRKEREWNRPWRQRGVQGIGSSGGVGKDLQRFYSDSEPALAAKYGIQAMPTFLFLAPGGKETGRIVGADKEALTAKVKEMAGE